MGGMSSTIPISGKMPPSFVDLLTAGGTNIVRRRSPGHFGRSLRSEVSAAGSGSPSAALSRMETISMPVQPEESPAENQSTVIRRATRPTTKMWKNLFRSFCNARRPAQFPSGFPSSDFPIHILSMMFSHPSFFCVVAEQGGQDHRKQLPGREGSDCRRWADHH